MDLKNIILNTAELGPVNWEDVEKLQPNDDGYICFVSYMTETKTDVDGESYEVLVGNYIQTNFTHKPTYKEMINYIVQQEYPDGKEAQMLRLGIYDPDNDEFLAYYDRVEEINEQIKALLK